MKDYFIEIYIPLKGDCQLVGPTLPLECLESSLKMTVACYCKTLAILKFKI